MSSSPITFLSSGNLLLKDCDMKDGLRPASVDGGVVLSAKKKAAGITYQMTATEATVKNARALSGAWVSMSKPMGDHTTGTVTYDLAGKTAAAAVLNSIKLAGGKALDVGARWAEKGNAFSLEVGGKPHPAHRFFTSINPATRAVLGSWTADIAGLTLQAARNFAKGSDQLSVGRTLPNGVKAVCSYAPQDAVASATFGKGPLRGGVRAKRLANGGFGKPSISLGVDRDFQVESVPVPFLSRSRSSAAALPPPAPEPAFSLSRVADGARSLLGSVGLTEGGGAGPRYVRGIKVETYSVA